MVSFETGKVDIDLEIRLDPLPLSAVDTTSTDDGCEDTPVDVSVVVVVEIGVDIIGVVLLLSTGAVVVCIDPFD